MLRLVPFRVGGSHTNCKYLLKPPASVTFCILYEDNFVILGLMTGRDDSLSASQLRQRYTRGGDAKDDELTASQLRARHAIQSNAKDFSTAGGSQGLSSLIQVIGGVLVLAGLVLWLLRG